MANLLAIYGPPPAFVTHNDDESLAAAIKERVCHTSFCARYSELLSLFGAPLNLAKSDFSTQWILRFDDGAQVRIVDSRDPPADGKPLPSTAEVQNPADETLRAWLILAGLKVPAIARVQSALFARRMADRGVDAIAMGKQERVLDAVGIAFGRAMRLPVSAARLPTHRDEHPREPPANTVAAAGDGYSSDIVEAARAALPPAIAAAVAKWKPLRFLTHNEDAALIDRRGVLQGYLGASAIELQNLFGPPLRREGVHITLEWGVRFEDGSCVWIHDWDATNRVNPELPPPESMLDPRILFNGVEWHVVCEALRPAQKLLRTMTALRELCAYAAGDELFPVCMHQAGSEASASCDGSGGAGASGGSSEASGGGGAASGVGQSPAP